MWAGIAALASAERLGAVGEAVEDVVDGVPTTARPTGERGTASSQEYVGHGIGTAMHQPPDVLNYRAPRARTPGAARAVRGGRADARARLGGTRVCSRTTGPS